MLKNKKEKHFLKKIKNGENPKGEKMKKIIFGLVAVLAFMIFIEAVQMPNYPEAKNLMVMEKLELNGFHSVEKNLKQELG